MNISGATEEQSKGDPLFKLFVGGTLIDGTGKGSLEDSAVLIEDSRIKSVGQRDEIAIPEGTSIMDVSGKTIMPGLIDAHVHLGTESLGRQINPAYWNIMTCPTLKVLHALRNAQLTLEAGFTSLRNVVFEQDPWDVSLKSAIELGIAKGPRIVASGGLVSMTAGHLDLCIPGSIPRIGGRTADGVSGVRKAVRERVREGADFIKICTSGGVVSLGDTPEWRNYTLEEVEVICDEAHALQRRVMAHAEGSVGVKNALRGNVDTLEHGYFIDQEDCEMMKSKNIILVPTLGISRNILEKGEELGVAKEGVEKLKRFEEFHVESVKRAHRQGVKIALGTDALANVFSHGENAFELECLVEVGLSPMEAIVAGTMNAAEAIGLGKETGTVEEGKLADMIIVDGNPLEDIRILRNKANILAAIKDGQTVVDRGLAN